jgi:hypothetical protein
MSHAARFLLLLNQASAPTLVSYIASLAPALWVDFDQESSPLPNKGSSGPATVTAGGTITLTTDGATFDGATAYVECAINAGWVGPTFTYAFLINPASLGELNQGAPFAHGSGGGTRRRILYATTNRLTGTVPATTAATSTTTNNQAVIGSKHWLFMTYDDSDDRKIRYYKGIGGAVTELTVTTPTAATGTITTPFDNGYIGNNSAFSETFDGVFYTMFEVEKVLSSAEMLQLTNLAGV